VPQHVARLVTRLVAPLIVDYSTSRRLIVDYFASAKRPGASARARLVAPLVVDYSASRRLIIDYFASAARPGASARRAARRAAHRRLLRFVQARRVARRSSSTTPCVRVPQHVAWLVTRLITPLVVDYSASRRLVVDYFASAARPGASAHRTAHHAARRAAHRRLLCLAQPHRTARRSSSTTPRVRVPRHVARLVTRLVSPLVVDYSASRRLVVDYFAYAAHLGASARRAARHTARRAAHRRLLRLAQARRAAHRSSSTTPPHAGSSRGSSLVVDYSASRRLFARLVAPLVIDYFAYAARPGASARREARHDCSVRLKSVSHGNLKSTSKVAYESLLCAATKVDFDFQVASQSPPCAATKVDFGF
jgi:hypothetical protein